MAKPEDMIDPTSWTMNAELGEKLVRPHSPCGRPNRHNEPCGMRTDYGAPCKNHRAGEKHDVAGMVRAIMNHQQEMDASRTEYRIEDAAETYRLAVEMQATLRPLKQSEMAEFLHDDVPRRCGRLTDAGRPCSLNCEGFAIACKWHMSAWERNTHLIAQQAFFMGMDARERVNRSRP